MTKLARYSNVCAVALRLYPRYIQPYLCHPRYPLWCRSPAEIPQVDQLSNNIIAFPRKNNKKDLINVVFTNLFTFRMGDTQSINEPRVLHF